MIDLHLHSSCSDGILTPEQLISAAQQSGLTTIALCDHDTVAGVEAAILSGNKLGMEVIPGVELSVCFKGYSDVHLLGYWIDIHARELTEQLDRFAFRRSNATAKSLRLLIRCWNRRHGEPLTLTRLRRLLTVSMDARILPVPCCSVAMQPHGRRFFPLSLSRATCPKPTAHGGMPWQRFNALAGLQYWPTQPVSPAITTLKIDF